MSDKSIKDRIDVFFSSRLHRPRWKSIPEALRPTSLDEAYQVQAGVYRRLSENGIKRVGYKIGCTTAAAQDPFGLSEPIYAGIFQTSQSGDLTSALVAPLVAPALECEVAVRMQAGLSHDADLSHDAVIAAVGEVFIACEIVDYRYDASPTSLGAATLLVDDFLHAGFVLGEAKHANSEILSDPRATIKIDNEFLAKGAPSPFPPISALAWLVRKLSTHKSSLRAGDIVLTGSFTPPIPVSDPKSITMEIGGLGSLNLTD